MGEFVAAGLGLLAAGCFAGSAGDPFVVAADFSNSRRTADPAVLRWE